MNITRAASIFSIAIVISALILGIFFYSSRHTDETIRVVGYATESFPSDIAKWSFTFSEIVPLNGRTAGYKSMNKKLKMFQNLWSETQINTEEISIQPISVRKDYGEKRIVQGYELTQSIYIISKDVSALEKIAINPIIFTENNLAFGRSDMEYYCTRLPELKKQLLAKATQNAIERAEEIANPTNAKISKLLSARSGIFQITKPFSNEFSNWGVHENATRNKTIKVTVTTVFSIR